MTNLLLVALGSLAGGFSRVFLAGAVHRSFGNSFPYGTLVVNLLGCFGIGLLNAIAQERSALQPAERALLTMSFFGAFTTFSAFMVELDDLSRSGESIRAVMYVSLSILAGFFVFRLGTLLGRSI